MSDISKLPLNDAIAVALSKLINDSGVTSRMPSHSDLEQAIRRAGLIEMDPHKDGKPVGKAKRVQAILNWAIDNDCTAGERLVFLIITLVKSVGGFREDSPNYTGREEIANLRSAFRHEGYTLHSDGTINKTVLDNLSNIEKHHALLAYAKRAMKGAEDAALLVGTSKDLLEAVAAFVLESKYGSYSTQSNFPTLLGQAFVALGLATSETKQSPNFRVQERCEKAIYELACSVNQLRNKEGAGHGRPFLSTVTADEAKMAIEAMGLISEFLLSKLSNNT